jgi:hypothetical protein
MFARSIADSGSSQNELERVSWPRPVLTNKRAAIDANERMQHQPDDDHVIESASDRNEVGHEIERQGQIADQADQQEFATTRHARIRKQRRINSRPSGMKPASARASGRRPATTRAQTATTQTRTSKPNETRNQPHQLIQRT